MCQSSTERLYVATDDEDISNEIIGYCSTQSVLDEGEILRIAIRPSKRRNGIGRALLSSVVSLLQKDGCRTMFLEVQSANVPAIGLYESFGFKKISERKDYYAKGVHAVIYNLQLD